MTRSLAAALATFSALVVCVLAIVSAPRDAWGGDYVLIDNAKSGVTQLSKRDVRSLFVGETKTLGGSVAQAVISPPDSGEFAFLSSLYGLAPRELIAKIRQEVFRGEMRRPIVCQNPGECIAAVARNDGGICFVPSAAAASLPAGVVRVAMTE
jgi:hypothetical protein